MQRVIGIVVAALALCGLAASPVHAQLKKRAPAEAPARRVLIIGNASYAHLGALENPVRDARRVYDALKVANPNFRVHREENATGRRMRELLADFAVKAPGSEAAIIYFAGHGAEIDERGWLFPVDAPASADNLEDTAVNLDDVIRATEGAATRFVVIDACRNNPFTFVTRGAAAPTAAVALGSRLEPAGAAYVLFSATRGAVAQDGVGDVSPFAAAFSGRIVAPASELRSVVVDVVRLVRRDTGGVQAPKAAGLAPVSDFYFRAPAAGMASAPRIDVPAPPGAARIAAVRALPRVRDCPTCPELLRVPAGEFLMGSPQGERGRAGDEGPQRRPRIAAFHLGRTEVTFDQWRACVRDGGCNGFDPRDNDWGRGDRPVINVSRADAQRYAAWLSRKTGKRYRLPTESEWEYAARGGAAAAYPWFPEANRGFANYGHEACCLLGGKAEGADRFVGTAPAGAFPPNGFGFVDLHGNVAEVLEDCFVGDYRNAPLDNSAVTRGLCLSFVVRGGAWNGYASEMRSAARAQIRNDERKASVGFRVARD